jgi:hypothetical protein
MAARYGRAQQLLDQAAALAGSDPSERASILLVHGMCLTDTGRYAESIDLLEDSVNFAADSGDAKRQLYCLSWLGRVQLLHGEFGAARQTLRHALALSRSTGWTWSTALPESFLGEVEIHEGNLQTAGSTLEHALAIACQVGDTCFESLSLRALGLLEAAHGNREQALTRLDQARMCQVTTPDYTWSLAYTLDALCTVAVDHDLDAAAWINDLESIGGRTGMREFVARAYLHRAHHGDTAAIHTARLMSADIDNPRLHGLLT